MPYLIDSDCVIDHLGQVAGATQLLASLADEAMYISIVTYLEVYQGSLRADDPARARSELRAFIDEVPILPVTEAVAERCARLREDALRQGKRPNRRAFDLLIAATALENDLSLITRNVRDYRDVPGAQTLRRLNLEGARLGLRWHQEGRWPAQLSWDERQQASR